MMLQLNPSFEILTPKGMATAFAITIPTQEDNIQWITFLKENGQCWTFDNTEIRAVPQWTLGRMRAKRSSEIIKELQEKHSDWEKC